MVAASEQQQKREETTIQLHIKHEGAILIIP
jgi:hypothetical protein